MASLAQIATKIKDLAAAKAPVKTGNLKRKIKDFNRPSGMIKENKNNKSRSFEFTLDVSPPGAEYGKYWNSPYGKGNGTTAKLKSRYPEHFDFAEKAINDPQIEKMIQDYLGTIAEEVANEIGKTIKDLDK
jgi:hypothetical protein